MTLHTFRMSITKCVTNIIIDNFNDAVNKSTNPACMKLCTNNMYEANPNEVLAGSLFLAI